MNDLIKQIIKIKKAINPKVIELQDKIKNKFNITVDVDNYGWLKDIADALFDLDIPKKHIENNPSLKTLDTDPAKDFYSKHNRETHTITLSDQLFDPEFRKKQPFHRIKGVTTLKELLTHEIGHAVGGMLGDAFNSKFEKQFGWESAKSNRRKKELESQGYVDSLKAFLAVPKEKLTTVDDKERQRIAEKIKREGTYQKPKKCMKISWYGITGPREDFAESYTNYVLNADNFHKIEPERYAFVKDNVFMNKEYGKNALRKSVIRIKKILAPYTDIDTSYGYIPMSKEALIQKKKLAEEIAQVKKCLV